jgi:hypothetical protein
MEIVTTANLASKLGIPTDELYNILEDLDFVYNKNGKWFLTLKGKDLGAFMAKTKDNWEYIIWPEDFKPPIKNDFSKAILTATKIGEKFDVSSQRVNNIFAELGWIEEAVKGWKITYQGKQIGGFEHEHQSGAKYVTWPDSILTNRFLLKAIHPAEYLLPNKSTEIPIPTKALKSENKYPESILKAKDGHLVRSRAELIIDNLLYDYRLLHAYERELTVAETILSDFYIPPSEGKKAVYIEFWGIKDDPKYLERKKHKLEIYNSHKLNLIELDDKDLDNIDSILRKKFLKFDIDVE